MSQLIKTFVKNMFVLPGAGRPFAGLLQNRATVFMLHRFRRPDPGSHGQDPTMLRRALAHLRRERYELLDLEDLVRRLAGDGPAPRRAVAFTIDDGYADQAEVGAPVFAEFDCPVTTFVTSGFVDGTLWFWWDKIEYIFEKTKRKLLQFGSDDGERPLTSPEERNRAREAFTAWCKTVPDERKHSAIHALAVQAEVDLPSEAPAEFAPMSWPQLRRCENGGMRFGPHTVTHPILARTPDDQARSEILDSWRRVKEEAGRPVPVFCYPNGQPSDYGPREFSYLEEAGLIAAVVGTPGYASRAMLQEGGAGPFTLPRFNFPDDVSGVVQYASGMERLKGLLTGAR